MYFSLRNSSIFCICGAQCGVLVYIYTVERYSEADSQVSHLTNLVFSAGEDFGKKKIHSALFEIAKYIIVK